MANEIVEAKVAARIPRIACGVFSNELLVAWFRFAGVKPKSQVTYLGVLKQLFTFFAAHNIARPVRADLEDWIQTLKDTKKSPATINLYVSVMKIFFRWLAQEGFYATNISDNLKGSKDSDDPKKTPLSPSEAAKLFSAIKGDTLLAKRNRAIVALMLSTGARTVEIERAKVKNLVEVSGVRFLEVWGKGRDEADKKVRIAPQVGKLIDEYLAARGEVDGDAPLFVSESRSNRGQGISTQTIRKMVKKLLRETVITDPKNDKKYSAHGLRTTAAITMLRSGASLLNVQQALRHVNVGTTQRYLRALERLENDAEIRAANAIFGDTI